MSTWLHCTAVDEFSNKYKDSLPGFFFLFWCIYSFILCYDRHNVSSCINRFKAHYVAQSLQLVPAEACNVYQIVIGAHKDLAIIILIRPREDQDSLVLMSLCNLCLFLLCCAGMAAGYPVPDLPHDVQRPISDQRSLRHGACSQQR